MAIWFPVFPIYKSVPFWEFGQCKLPPVDFAEDQKITSFKCLHRGILYSFIQFCKKRKFRIKACLLSWNCCLLKEPVHNFSSSFFFHLLSFFSCCCVAAFQNFFVVFWIGCLVIKQWCLFFISLNYTHFGSYLLKIRFLGAFTGVTGWNLISF